MMHDDQLSDQKQIRLKKGQFLVLQKMCEYALPALYGWNAIYDPSIVAPK
jgi:hypothetical protein